MVKIPPWDGQYESSGHFGTVWAKANFLRPSTKKRVHSQPEGMRWRGRVCERVEWFQNPWE